MLGEHEGTERAVERGPDGVLADELAVVRADVAEAQREHGAVANLVALDGGAGLASLGPEELGVDTGARRVHHLDELARALGGGLVRAGVLGPRVLLPEQVPLLVEHRLQVALLAVVQHEPPVRRLVAHGRGPGGELTQQLDGGRPVEEAPERIRDQHREPGARVVADVAPAAQTPGRENRRCDALLVQPDAEDRRSSHVPAHRAGRVSARDEYVDEVVDPATQRPGPDLVADDWANGERFRHGLLLGPLTLGTRRDHAYYVKLAVAPMPATPRATALR